MTQHTSIYWLRQDLRLSDNPALLKAAADGAVVAVYILDDENAGDYVMGGASRWWLHHSLKSLSDSIPLNFYRGNAEKILPEIAKEHEAKAVYWNRCYEPWRIVRDKRIKEALNNNGITAESFNGSLLWEPWQILKDDGTPYRVFTPFYRNGCLGSAEPRMPFPAPDKIDTKQCKLAIPLDALGLLPAIRWDKQLAPHWRIGEQAAHNALTDFIDNGLAHYKQGRDFPARPYVSRLSPHLHFGEISPNQAWYAALGRQQRPAPHESDKISPDIAEPFCRELGWREFSYHMLYHFPELPHKNWQRKFDGLQWRIDDSALKSWQRGRTGYPIIDAGMRELWQTGYMHNRVRMIAASFLVKNLLIDWRRGAEWFWDCLVDADLASNSASWQWVAGCGADAAPYFRIFNPVTQGKKFDPDGEYTRHFVPELKQLPDKYLFCPWQAPDNVLSKAGITLGKEYPLPVIDLPSSRSRALAAFANI